MHLIHRIATIALSTLLRATGKPSGARRFLRRLRAFSFLITLASPLVFSGSAYAGPGSGVDFTAGAGFGLLAAGITSGRFAISPSASLIFHGKARVFRRTRYCLFPRRDGRTVRDQ